MTKSDEEREKQRRHALAKLITNHRKARRLLLDLTNMTEPLVRGKFNEDIDALYAEIDRFLPREESAYGREQRMGAPPSSRGWEAFEGYTSKMNEEASKLLLPQSMFGQFKQPSDEKVGQLSKLIEDEVGGDDDVRSGDRAVRVLAVRARVPWRHNRSRG